MCYFLYGAINQGANDSDLLSATKNFSFRFNIGDIRDVNLCVKNCTNDFRITTNHCDCKTAIGSNNPDEMEIKELSSLLFKCKDVRGIKYALISKNWWQKRNKRQETVHIDDIDVPTFLAGIQDNCLYKIELYKKYY